MAKSNRKQVLGRGLSAILNDPNNSIESASNKNADQLIKIPMLGKSDSLNLAVSTGIVLYESIRKNPI